MEFVRAGDFSRTRQGDRVAPARAAFRREQVIPAVALVKVRAFGKSKRRAGENVFPLADELPVLDRIFLQNDAGETVVSGPMVPEHVHQILAAVVVMEERRVKPAAVEINRLGPVAVHPRAGDEIIGKIAQRRAACAADRGAAITLHVGVDQPEQSVGVRETRCPDAAGIGVAEHVELTGAIERAGEQPPVDEVARMMDLHARKPLEGRGGDVIIVANAEDGWIGIETGEDGILDVHAGSVLGGAARRRAASSTSIWLTRFWLSG